MIDLDFDAMLLAGEETHDVIVRVFQSLDQDLGHELTVSDILEVCRAIEKECRDKTLRMVVEWMEDRARTDGLYHTVTGELRHQMLKADIYLPA